MLAAKNEAAESSAASAGAYTLFLLTVVNTFNFIDRQVLSILQEAIKLDLGLSDSQLGLLTGFAFSLFYVAVGIPIARLADHSSRRTVIAWSVGIWSGMTALCGLAQNYLHLFAARIGVGIGEAGCSPAAHSMISNIYPVEKRASALSIYSSGTYIGMLFGFMFGGWLNHYLGWRLAFVIVGLPGIALALLMRYTVAEPVRPLSPHPVSGTRQPKTLRQVCALLWSRRSFRYIAGGGALGGFVMYGVLAWLAPFMIRTYGMDTRELGGLLALSVGVGGGIGMLLLGILADRLAARDKRWYAWLPALTLLVSAPAFVAVFTLKDSMAVMLVNMLPMAMSGVFTMLSITMIHSMVAPDMRAMGSAIFFLIGNLVGNGLGPLVIGMTSDALMPLYGAESLRLALLYIAPPTALLAALLYWRAASTLREDLANAPH